MTSPAKRHFQRVMARKSQPSVDGATVVKGNAYELMLAKLHTDRARLSDIQSIERKVEVKRELLADYQAWIDGVLESGRGGQDDVLMTLLVWYIDTGEYERALDVAEYAMQHDLVLPDQYSRTLATVLADEIGGAALACQRSEKTFPVDILQRTVGMTSDADMPDPARAKLHKALGVELMSTLPHDALTHLNRALDLHEGVGVKRYITSIEAAIKKEETTGTPN